MERDQNADASPPRGGVCYRLFNFLINNFPLYKFKQISHGVRSSSSSSIPAFREVEGIDSSSMSMGEQDSKVLVYLLKDDLAQLAPEAVERLETMDKTNGRKSVEAEKKMKKVKSAGNASMEKSVTFKLDEEEYKARQPSMAMKDGWGEGKALKDEYKEAGTNKVRMDEQPAAAATAASQAKVSLKPRKPVMRAASNIDEISESFIQKRKKSFAS